MRGSGRILIGILLLLVVGFSKIQAQSLWAEVSFDRSNVYLGQPVKVSITVYTSTWFTDGLDLGNIKVNGAFTVYFRPVTTSFIKDGNTFAGVKQIYHVFPYTDEDITFPELEIEVESPPPGEFKGLKQIVKTQAKSIQVKPIPSKFSDGDWLVADGMSVTENWSSKTTQVKVGDVLERKISRTVGNTVSELIPPIAWDSVASVSMYPSRSSVNNNKTKTAISASRTETMRYLFEKEGEVILPEMVFTWYNPYRNQLYKRTLKEVKIEVIANPDLGVLASVRDSLNLQVKEQVGEEAEEEQPWRIFGMSPEKFAAVLALAALILIVLYRLLRKGILHWNEKRQAYLVSEGYYFHEFKKAANGTDPKKTSARLYRWIDAMELTEPSATFFAKQYGSDSLMKQVSATESQWGNGSQFSGLDIKEWESARQNYLNRGVVVETGWINPV